VRDERPGRDAAIKVLPRPAADDPERISRHAAVEQDQSLSEWPVGLVARYVRKGSDSLLLGNMHQNWHCAS
jgi:hypothetical protein